MRPANAFERGSDRPPKINTIVVVAGRTQALNEDFAATNRILQEGGASFPEVMVSLSTLHEEVEGFSVATAKARDIFQAW